MHISLVPRFHPAFQCCTLKRGRAWCMKSRAVCRRGGQNNEHGWRIAQDFNLEVDHSKRAGDEANQRHQHLWKYIHHLWGWFLSFWWGCDFLIELRLRKLTNWHTYHPRTFTESLLDSCIISIHSKASIFSSEMCLGWFAKLIHVWASAGSTHARQSPFHLNVIHVILWTRPSRFSA